MVGDGGAEAVEHFMHGNKIGTTHVPMRLLGDQRQIDELHNLMVRRLDDGLLGLLIHVITGVQQVREFVFTSLAVLI